MLQSKKTKKGNLWNKSNSSSCMGLVLSSLTSGSMTATSDQYLKGTFSPKLKAEFWDQSPNS
jgi:hypothetical protein